MNENLQQLTTNVLRRGVGILIQPSQTLKDVAQEPGGLKELFFPYGITMVLIPAVMTLFTGLSTPLASAKMSAYLFFVPLVLTLVMGLVMIGLAPLFGAKKSYVLSCRVLIYATTPNCAASVLGIFPLFGPLLFVAAILWTMILLYQGIGIVLEVKGVKQLLFLLSMVLVYGLMAAVPIKIMMSIRSKSVESPTNSSSIVQTSDQPEIDYNLLKTRPVSVKVNEAIDEMIKEAVSDGSTKPEDIKAVRYSMLISLTPDQIREIEAGHWSNK